MGLLKRNSKRAMAIILSASMVVGSMGISFAASFSDVNNHWAANQIKSLVSRGIISGYNDGTFKPDNYITRAEFISLINKAFNYKLVYDINYKDTSSKDWFYEDLRKAKAKGYISGYEDNTIRPNNKITRQEVAVIMAKVLNKQSGNKEYVSDRFKDSDKIADWSKKSIGALVDSKKMSGYPDGTFGPEKYITRAEAVTVIYKKFKGSGYSSSSSRHSSNYDEKSKNRDNDVVLDDKGDRLENKTIDGDLTISSHVGDGEVYLEDVTVKGTTYIYGGGENSVYLEDCDLGKVVVDKNGDDVRLVAQGSTTIDTVTLKSGAILEEDTSGSDKLTKSGFDDVSIEDDHKVTLKGDFDDVDIEVKDADLYLQKGEISKVSIKDDAEDAYIYVASSTKISTIDADEAARVKGSGYVKKIEGSKRNSVSRTHSSSGGSSHSNRDTTAPVVSGVSSANIENTSADIKLKSNESGTVYYVVLPKTATPPSNTQVRDGKDSKNTTVTSETEATLHITGLTAGTEYTVYVVARDSSGNISTVKNVDITTYSEDEMIAKKTKIEVEDFKLENGLYKSNIKIDYPTKEELEKIKDGNLLVDGILEIQTNCKSDEEVKIGVAAQDSKVIMKDGENKEIGFVYNPSTDEKIFTLSDKIKKFTKAPINRIYNDIQTSLYIQDLPKGDFTFTLKIMMYNGEADTVGKEIASASKRVKSSGVDEKEKYATTFNITDADGVVADATVVVKSGETVVNAESDGSYKLEAGEYTYTVSKEGYKNATGAITVTDKAVAQDVILTKTVVKYATTFNITDADGVVADATVVVKSGETVVNAESDGSYKLEAGEYTYTVSKEGYKNATGAITVADKAVAQDVILTKTVVKYATTFNITDTDGVVADATVVVKSGETVVNAESDGSYKLEAGEYTYTVSKEGYKNATGAITVTDKAVAQDVILTKTVVKYATTFNITDADGVVADATVVVKSGETVVNAESDGSYKLEAGEYTYTVSKEGYKNATGAITVADKAVAQDVILTKTVVKYATTFNITDADGVVADATVVVKSGETVVNAESDGSYKLEAGEYTYTVSKEGYKNATGAITVADKAVAQDVILTKTVVKYATTFNITDADGVVADATVVVKSGETVVNAESDGSYKLEAGEYTYTVSKEGYKNATGAITVTDKAVAQDVTLTKTVVKYTTTFNITDADGVVADATVVVKSGETVVNAESDGSYKLEAGEYTYTVSKEGYKNATGAITVVDKAVAQDVTLTKIL
ncbi:S-layer homology domain-containing protein [Tepidibacter hydrothermalis]|uniref:S-layer homology domain-containing protein n=1 Tax=Tepidibacter hydrothermalis TaxID=3036126 RepID=A0ABY8EH66_9FIRM|nr:S-layer homology domain-containing protein [Tepidibacter hydrothermalis]WFD11114.1 S-layer homology domain-containing protein [Tepidibacter hydrothermalis]